MSKSINRNKKLKARDRQKKLLDIKEEKERKALLSKIIRWDDPILKTKAKEVDNFKGNLAVAKDLSKIVEATKDGVGLSANQIGSLHRVFITRPNFPNKKDIYTFINPTITKYGTEKVTDKEGCLSYPGHYCDVERSKKIIIDYTDEKGYKQTEEFTDWHARIIQHEYDHLQAICKVGNDYFESKNEKKANNTNINR